MNSRSGSPGPQNTRCSAYPDCNSGTCPYVHPKPDKLCSWLPDCVRGDTCTYFHPICDKGTECKSKKCVFLHPKGPCSNLQPWLQGRGKRLPSAADIRNAANAANAQPKKIHYAVTDSIREAVREIMGMMRMEPNRYPHGMQETMPRLLRYISTLDAEVDKDKAAQAKTEEELDQAKKHIKSLELQLTSAIDKYRQAQKALPPPSKATFSKSLPCTLSGTDVDELILGFSQLRVKYGKSTAAVPVSYARAAMSSAASAEQYEFDQMLINLRNFAQRYKEQSEENKRLREELSRCTKSG